ncbi:copper homeostasis protein CutC [Shewanella sp. GXUN23E]|uniref:copper homeostasis protein CutC n=1 Tax=Shewanella sp. GXUN23E TaxID=3422498 RepID=UPI003D7F0BAD
MSGRWPTLEICVSTDDLDRLPRNVMAAQYGGARRIELCSDMKQQGLTPCKRAVKLAREFWGPTRGVLAMIRPRGGDFNYSDHEVRQMGKSIRELALAGADGVVFGVLDAQRQLEIKANEYLLDIAAEHGLSVTFHRAFDAVANPLVAIEWLKSSQVSRVLSSGCHWPGANMNAEARSRLVWLLERLDGALELVIGGGLKEANVKGLLELLQPVGLPYSLHCHSAVLREGATECSLVSRLHRMTLLNTAESGVQQQPRRIK